MAGSLIVGQGRIGSFSIASPASRAPHLQTAVAIGTDGTVVQVSGVSYDLDLEAGRNVYTVDTEPGTKSVDLKTISGTTDRMKIWLRGAVVNGVVTVVDCPDETLEHAIYVAGDMDLREDDILELSYVPSIDRWVESGRVSYEDVPEGGIQYAVEPHTHDEYVLRPGTATNLYAIPRWADLVGAKILNSGVTIDANDNVAGVDEIRLNNIEPQDGAYAKAHGMEIGYKGEYHIPLLGQAVTF